MLRAREEVRKSLLISYTSKCWIEPFFIKAMVRMTHESTISDKKTRIEYQKMAEK